MALGRPRRTLYSAIDNQMRRKLRQVGFNDLKRSLAYSNRDITVVSILKQDSSVTETNSPNASANDYGYDYSTSPPTPDVEYETTSERFDNLDDYIFILQGVIVDLQDQVDYLEDQIVILSALWYTIEYVAGTSITQIALPDIPIEVRVFKNGIRLMSGESYDYTVSGNVVSVIGITGDRFVIDYSSTGAGS